jgi:hypothetical protein
MAFYPATIKPPSSRLTPRNPCATDDLGYHAIEKPTTVYDLWATVLHQLGLDHEKLTYLYAGRNVRLTDVHGNVWKDLVT